MILNFRNQSTKDIFNGKNSKLARKIPKSVWKIACRKLDMLNAAKDLKDLLSPPSNYLEMLKSNLRGFYSIRINSQYRIIFKWVEGNAKDVQIIDYH